MALKNKSKTNPNPKEYSKANPSPKECSNLKIIIKSLVLNQVELKHKELSPILKNFKLF
jgi:hypothetical protein